MIHHGSRRVVSETQLLEGSHRLDPQNHIFVLKRTVTDRLQSTSKCPIRFVLHRFTDSWMNRPDTNFVDPHICNSTRDEPKTRVTRVGGHSLIYYPGYMSPVEPVNTLFKSAEVHDNDNRVLV